MSVSDERDQSLSALEHEMGVLIRRVRRAIAVRARLVHPDLSAAGYQILAALEEEAARSSSLAETFAIDKGAVSRQVQQLEDLGLVRRAPDPTDGRASLLDITELGRERLAEVARVRRDVWGDRLSDWTESDLSGFVGLLARYNAAGAKEA